MRTAFVDVVGALAVEDEIVAVALINKGTVVLRIDEYLLGQHRLDLFERLGPRAGLFFVAAKGDKDSG